MSWISFSSVCSPLACCVKADFGHERLRGLLLFLSSVPPPPPSGPDSGERGWDCKSLNKRMKSCCYLNLLLIGGADISQQAVEQKLTRASCCLRLSSGHRGAFPPRRRPASKETSHDAGRESRSERLIESLMCAVLYAGHTCTRKTKRNNLV